LLSTLFSYPADGHLGFQEDGTGVFAHLCRAYAPSQLLYYTANVYFRTYFYTLQINSLKLLGLVVEVEVIHDSLQD